MRLSPKHQISSVYKKHPFIIIDKEVKSQNGNFGYDVSVDDDKTEVDGVPEHSSENGAIFAASVNEE